MTTHYHAYAYTGRGYTDTQIRRGEAPANYPPIEIADTRRKPGTRLDTLEAALTWLEQKLTDQPPLDAAAFPVAARLAYSRSHLQQTAAPEVVYGYWTASGRYVARQVHPCNDPVCQE